MPLTVSLLISAVAKTLQASEYEVGVEPSLCISDLQLLLLPLPSNSKPPSSNKTKNHIIYLLVASLFYLLLLFLYIPV